MPFNVYSQNILTLCFHFAPSTFCAIVVTYFISMHVLCTVNYQLRFKSHFVFWPHMSYRILVPRTGIEPLPPALEARSLSHWTCQGSPKDRYFCKILSNCCSALMQNREVGTSGVVL